MAQKYVVVSGISSGIGQFICENLIREGFFVIGTQRQVESDSNQHAFQPGFKSIAMDLTDEASILTAALQIEQLVGSEGLYALVNNAGQAIPGPLSELPIEQLKYQFQVNVFGHFLFTQKLIPLLRIHGHSARIINISSVSGLFAAPFLGAYAASKFALEGLSDSWRRELKLLGIPVVLIEPGPLKTKIWQKHLGIADLYKGGSFDSYLQKADEIILNIEQSALPLSALKKPFIKALLSTKPKPRYLIHKNKILFLLLIKILPDSWADFLVNKNLKSANKKLRPI